jgi:hypothetical protein
MGVLIEMAIRNQAPYAEVKAEAGSKTPDVDLSVWKTAPRERTGDYFPTYSAVSKAMQAALRGWVREWFQANPEILQRPHAAYAILVFQCTHPFVGRTTNMFTYDIQQTEALNRAFASAASRLGRELKTLDTTGMSWFKREHYFAYRSKEVVKYVMKNRRALYRMLNVETMIMDAILKFALIDIPKLGVEDAAVLLRRAVNTQLRRFSEEFDLSPKAEELLAIMTDTLIGKMTPETAMATPHAGCKMITIPFRPTPTVEMPLAA